MNDHNWTAQHLAWYLNGTLVGEEYARVHSHLKDCLVCQQELSAHQQVADAVSRRRDITSHPAAALGVLSDRLDEKQGAGNNWVHRLGSAFAQTPFSIRGFLAAQTALLVLASVLLYHNDGARSEDPNAVENQYRTLSSAVPISGDMRVIFTPDTSIRQMQEVLVAVGATIVHGPGKRGIITLTVDDSANNNALEKLRSSPNVQFAEPLGKMWTDPE